MYFGIRPPYELGGNAFVVKPASLEKRVALAQVLGTFWLEFNEGPIVCTEGLESARKLRKERGGF